MTSSKYHVRQSDVKPYSPANHVGTQNYRMIGAETVGAKQIEMLIGEVEQGKGALPHAHPGIEQRAKPSRCRRARPASSRRTRRTCSP
jgi:hypothetical protein